MQFDNFKTCVNYLPPNSDVLLLGTGPSIIYNLNCLLEYIKTKQPILIGINGYLKGIRTISELDLHSEYYRNDVDMSKIPHRASLDSLLPHVMFTNYLLQGEKYNPSGKLQDKKIRGDKFSPVLTESKKDNLFYMNFLSQEHTIKNNGIYVHQPNNPKRMIDGKIRKIYYGNIDSWNYNRQKKIDLFPDVDSKSAGLDIYKLTKGRDLKLCDLFDDSGIKFSVSHGGEYLLSWVGYNKPRSVAVCGIYDKFKGKSDHLICNWFWCKPSRLLPKNMIPNQQVIVDLFKKEYGSNFVDLNLKEEK